MCHKISEMISFLAKFGLIYKTTFNIILKIYIINKNPGELLCYSISGSIDLKLLINLLPAAVVLVRAGT